MKILTFDIEDWFHILDNSDTRSETSWSKFPSRLMANTERILCLLEETNQNATFFCLGWVADHHPEVIKLIAKAGYHIGTHSYAHQLAYEQSPEQFRRDLRRSIGVLQELTGDDICTYRAPGFSIVEQNLWAFEILAEEGITIDASLFPAGRAHGGLPHFQVNTPAIGKWQEHELKLFPMNTRGLFGKKFIYSGGGYFRIFPKTLINSWFKADEYVMTYFHPRDFDPDQPIVPGLSLARRFKSYVGLRGAERKLRFLLTNFQFMDIKSAAQQIEWNNAPAINLRSGLQLTSS